MCALEAKVMAGRLQGASMVLEACRVSPQRSPQSQHGPAVAAHPFCQSPAGIVADRGAELAVMQFGSSNHCKPLAGVTKLSFVSLKAAHAAKSWQVLPSSAVPVVRLLTLQFPGRIAKLSFVSLGAAHVNI